MQFQVKPTRVQNCACQTVSETMNKQKSDKLEKNSRKKAIIEAFHLDKCGSKNSNTQAIKTIFLQHWKNDPID